MRPQLPLVGRCENPIEGIRPESMREVAVGLTIADLAPRDGLICLVNGEWLSRLTREQADHVQALRDAGADAEAQLAIYAREARGWHEARTDFDDVIVWFDEMPQGREGFRVLLQIALIASILIPGGQTFTPYLAAANAAYNLLVPPRQPESPQAPGSVYSTSLAGNAARLDQPIWRNCGRIKITPPFAATPYTEFLPSDPTQPTENTDQYLYVVFCLGIGSYEVEKALIGKTSIHHFADVIRADYLAPGVQPTEALCNVVTSDEVFDSHLEDYRYVGGFAACRPGDRVARIGIDTACPKGLYSTTGDRTAEWQVEAREINDYGAPLGDWEVIGAEARTDNTTTPQRWTVWYVLSAPIRCEVRLARTDTESTVPEAVDELRWIGLRAELERAAPLNAEASHYEIVMRASEQLSGFSQRDFSMIVRGLVRTWDPVGGWGAEVFTRNAAWWLADLWTSSVWGEGMPDDRVNLQGLYDWSLTLDARQDRFDFSFSSTRDSWEAAQLIASSGRARAFRRLGVYTLQRDELELLPVAAITPRIAGGSMSLRTDLPRREQPDGVIAEFLSNVTWDTATVECPCPGVGGTDMMNPVFIRLDGVTGPIHAEREGLYQAADMALRRTRVTATLEMEATTLAFLDPIRWQPHIRGYGQAGDVAFWDPATLVMGLSEPPDFSGDPPYLTLQRDDGSLTTPVLVGPGPTAYDVTLPGIPDFDLAIDDGTRERPKFILGPLATGDEMAKITGISDGGSEGGAQLYDITAVVDDERVHQADNHLLPGPGDLQDPIDDGLDYSDTGGGIILLRLTSREVYDQQDSPTVAVATFRMLTTGQAQTEVGVTLGATTINLAGEWTTSPLDIGESADFEVYAQVTYGPLLGAVIGDAVDTWLSLGVDREWSVDANGDTQNIVILRVKIRRAGSAIVQVQRDIQLNAWSRGPDP